MTQPDAPTVLVADRLEIFRRGIAEVVQEAWPQWSCRAAGSFDELRGLMAGKLGDLLVLDIELPGLGGVAGLQQIHALHPDCAVLVIGDSDERSVILECLSAGALGYVLRTTSSGQLLRAIETILSGAVFAPACLAGRPSLVPAPAAIPEAPVKGATPALPQFTGRQNDVFQLLAQGCATKTIARQLNLAVGTVKVHLAAIYRQLGVSSRLEAVACVHGFAMGGAQPDGFMAYGGRSAPAQQLAA